MSKKRSHEQKVAAAKRRQIVSQSKPAVTPIKNQKNVKSPLNLQTNVQTKSDSVSFSWEKNFGYPQQLIFSDLRKTLITSLIILAVLFIILLYTK